MSHPDLLAPSDTRPIEVGEVWENPVTRERAVLVDLPWSNDEGPRGRSLDRRARYPRGG